MSFTPAFRFRRLHISNKLTPQPSSESHEPVTSTDPLKESTDTDALISSSDSKCNLLDDSQDLGSEEDPSQIDGKLSRMDTYSFCYL